MKTRSGILYSNRPYSASEVEDSQGLAMDKPRLCLVPKNNISQKKEEKETPYFTRLAKKRKLEEDKVQNHIPFEEVLDQMIQPFASLNAPSFTRTTPPNACVASLKAPLFSQLFEVKIDFDEASRAWMKNKKKMGDGSFVYV